MLNVLQKYYIGISITMLILMFCLFLGDPSISYSVFLINILYILLFCYLFNRILFRSSEHFFSTKTIFNIVFFLSIFFLILYKSFFYYYSNSYFEFSAKDTLQYDQEAKMLLKNGLQGIRDFLFYGGEMEDLGAIIVTAISYLIYPSTIVFNILNVFIGACTAVYVFKICSYFFSRRYAFLAAFSYSASSFAVYLYATGMKETIFVSIIVTAFYHLLVFWKTKSVKNLIYGILFLSLIVFFRPAVLILACIGILSANMLVGKRNKYFYISILLVIGLSFYFLDKLIYYQSLYSNITDNSVISEKNTLAPTKFNFFISYVSGLIGPFPSYAPIKGKEQQAFYALGISFRVLMSFFYFYGLYLAFKLKNFGVLAMGLFALFEILVLSSIMESFELRLNSPHLCFVYIVSFYAIANIDYKNESRKFYYVKYIYIFLFILILFWNYRLIS